MSDRKPDFKASSRAELKAHKQVVRAATFFCVLLVGWLARADAQVAVDISRIGDATHLEFSGISEWKYDFKRDAPKNSSNSPASGGQAGRVTLRLANVRPEALTKLRSHTDQLIKGVEINEKGLDGAAEISFSISDAADFFDYISDQPSKLVIDFFPKDSQATQSAQAPAKPAVLPNKPVVTQKPAAQLPKVTSAKSASKNDDEADDEEDDDASAESGVGRSRNPANVDGLIVAKSELPLGPSIAEQISSRKDFNHGIFDGGDPEFRRFSIKDYEIKEDSIIASRANFYLPFPMLELGTPQLKAMIAVAPTYEIVPSEARENKEARILLGLFTTNKRALFLKTAEEFIRDHPDSPYDEVIRYLMADAHYDIYRASNSVPDFETAMNHYLSLSEKYPTSPMAPRTHLLMGYSYLDRGDSFGALKAFQRFSRLHPTSKHIDRVNISIAEAYLKLNRFNDSFVLLDQIEKTGKTQKGREEAAFRKGDVHFRNRDFNGAIEQYRGAIQRYANAAGRFPNAWYNIAESEFQKQKYREGLEAYRTFLQKFPDHEHGGYAMTRMGELLGILGADPKRAFGAFMESQFRYRATPGAGVARIRMLIERMPDMKEKELASALLEIEQITKRYANRPITKQEQDLLAKEVAKEAAKEVAKDAAVAAAGSAEGVSAGASREDTPIALVPKVGEDATRRKPELPGIEEFTSLLVSDGYTARREYDTATQGLINFYQKNPQSPNKDKFKIRIVRNLTEGVRASVDKGDFMDALRRYSKNASGWLKNTSRIDVRYNVGRAYEQAGVYKEAAVVYQETLEKLESIKGKKEEREHNVFEVLPKLETVVLRQAVTAAKQKNFVQAETHLKKIATTKVLSEPEQIERAETAAEVAEARGQSEVARRYLTDLIKAWKGDAQLTSPLHLRLAALEIKTRNFKTANSHLETVLAWRKDNKETVSDDLHARALELRADLLVSRGKRVEAAKTYRELLAAYEDTRPLASVRYRLGQLLYQDGDLKGAEGAWKELQVKSKSEKEGIWQKLATEQMQAAKWQNEYKKYLNRIPAAAEMRDEESAKANQ